MKWIIIAFTAYWSLKIVCRLPFWAIKQHKLRQIKKFRETKCLGAFSKKKVLEVRETLKDSQNAEELKKRAFNAGAVVYWYWDEGFENCSIDELNCVIFHSILKELAEQKLKTAGC